MTYRGASAITDTKVIMVTGTNAFKNASLIMFQKISNILSIASFVLIVSSLTSAFIGYKYLSSEQFKSKIMKQIMNNVSSQIMPKALDNALPSSTGISIPLGK